MASDEDEAPPQRRPRRRLTRKTLTPLLVTVGIGGLLLGGLWIARAPLAENLIERELAARHVRMGYRIVTIGPRTQRIEDIVLGDPRNPDLTAKWVELDIALGGFMPTVGAVRAGGVRLKGSLHDGQIALGELDKFLGKGGSTETRLPDVDVQLDDARASILTDYGALGIVVGGAGNLRDGFDGRGVAAMPAVRIAGCGARHMLADLRIRMRNGAPRVTGPVTATTLACPQGALAMAEPRIKVDTRIDSKFASVDGSARLSAKALRMTDMTLSTVDAPFSLKASARSFSGEGRIGGQTLSGAGLIAGPSTLAFRFNGDVPRSVADVTGDLSLQDLAARGRDPLARVAVSVAGTPVAPLVARLARAVRDAGRSNRLTARIALQNRGQGGNATLSDVHFAAASGARLDMPAGSRGSLYWPDGRVSLDGPVTMGGGGLPDARLSVDRASRGTASGQLVVAPYRGDGRSDSRLALAPVRFAFGSNGAVRIATHVTLDGPLADGAVRGLSLPLAATMGMDGRFALDPGCVPIRWSHVRVSTLSLDPAALRLCPETGRSLLRGETGGIAGGARLSNVALTGRLGSNPLTLRAADFAFAMKAGQPGFRAGAIEARIGGAEAPVILGAGSLDGRTGAKGVLGRFVEGHGRIGSVPLALTDMAGGWRFAGGALTVDGHLRVADTAAEARFNPVAVPDATLTLADGRISAGGHVRHPTQGEAFARVDIGHILATGEGYARFALEGLRFDSALQPDDITPLALGVVANVDGLVTGRGEIRWTGSAVTSTGSFSTTDMKLAAAFGPVEGLSTTLNFTDLLAMETAPGQVATIKAINPGVLVNDGRVQYRLLPGSRARIEGGEWPFAGGRLTLLPSTMDFDAKGARHLIFRVAGLDAGAFINTMELKNLSATGTFDGLLPMTFDAGGGRIEAGILVARQEGLPPLLVESAQGLTVPCDPARQAGTLSYVGDVSNAEMGAYGKMAFDALKKLRYKCLTILLDGAIDGEFLTRIAINGVNQGSEESRRSALLRPFLGLPFLFNVRIEAPFRGLLNTYQSFVDPSALIRGSLGPQFQTVLENKLAVQPPDSENSLKKGHE